MPDNFLYYGDNLDILRRYIADESVDLVYLDPPFKSDQNYNVLFQEQNGSRSAAQIHAFEDTWHWDQAAAKAYQEIVETGGRVSQAMQAFRTFLGESDMMAYLAMMAPRLIELKRVLKPTGSIYLHCDPTASHYLKMLMDAIFNPVNFKNEIIWRRTGSHNSSKRFGPIHDVILFYWREAGAFFKQVFRPYLKGHVDSYFKSEDERGKYWTNALTGAGTRNGNSGMPWRSYNPTAVGRHWAIPGKIVTFLGIDEDLTPQEKLDALDASGFINHPAEDSKAMPTYRQYLEKSLGSPIPDLWIYQPHTHGCLYGTEECIDEDVRWLSAQGDSERLGYPTQKPVGLLERIIQASSNEGDTVLDPFCGCGTTITAAQKLNRKWIGIDITYLAVSLIKNRLKDMFGKTTNYEVIGEPTSLPDARALAEQDPWQFQWWALGLVGARPVEQKKGADRGIDGRLYFHDEADTAKAKTKQIIISVKAGHVTASQIRDLRGVVEREKAQIGVLLTMEEPTSAMRKEAAASGFYKSPWGSQHPTLQILTIEDLLNGRAIDFPHTGDVRTFKKAPKAKGKEVETSPFKFKE